MSTGLLLLRSPLVYCRLMAVFMHCCQSPPCSFQFAHRQFGIRQWKHHSLEGDFCCCVAVVSLLLHIRWFIVEFSGNCHPRDKNSHPNIPRDRRSQTLHAQSPHLDRRNQPDVSFSQCECELRSACRKKIRSPTMFWRHLQQVSYRRHKCEVMCGVGARPASIQCEVECGVGARPAVFSVRLSVSLCGGFWREEEVCWRFKGNISLKSFWWNSFLSYR